MYAFGGEGRFLIYPVTYKGKFGDDHDEELKRPKFTDFFNSNAIEIDVIADLRSVEGGREIVSSLLCRDFCLNVTEPGSDRDAFVNINLILNIQLYNLTFLGYISGQLSS